MIRLVLLHGDRRLLTLPLAARPIRIGRDPAADVVLEGPRISRLHATLEPDGEAPAGLRLVPHGRLPVALNGAPLTGPATVAEGDRIAIGPYELCLVADGGDAAAGLEPTLVAERPTEVFAYDRAAGRLVVQRPVLVAPDGRRLPVARRRLRIGTGPGNDVVLADPYVSAAHCVVVQTGGRFFVRDLGSTNGTWVDGRQVTEAELIPGTTLRLGRTRLVFESETVGPLALEADTATRCDELVGRSLEMRRLFALIRRVAPTESTVLVTGETGTGKELVARALHALSARSAGPFVAVNCGALAAELVESELFGHERGAFTGAVGRRAGAFEAASGGTLFLDEVGELPLTLQPKLLRALESRTVTRLGSSTAVPVDVRVVAATHRDLEAEVRAGRFREDLFFRLHVVPIEVPPLRERLEDLPLLAAHLLERLGAGRGRSLAPAALARLAAHDWPGNVRELRNVLERAALLADGDLIEADHLRFARVGPAAGSAEGGGATARRGPARRMEEVEREAIVAALEATGWNKRAAARALGIAKSTLHEKLRKWGLRAGPER
ncbi:MAG TPA: sigma 54-interacting transcriptional regulator [Thermodesulfobacteriota bacterium]|nr:sigma 54-interacting transcriptional regulator [Thermodesulfobacteriota bacterium]